MKKIDIFYCALVGVAIGIMIMALIIITGGGLPLAYSSTVESEPSHYIYLDESAQTGFMTSSDYDARFEVMEYPIAGSDNVDTVFLIDVFKYPSLSPISYRVDTWDEAVEALRGLAQ